MSEDNIADEIKDRCNIVEVIGRQVALKKAGNSYKGLCPFHSEKTPSFTVSEDKRRFVCYGCGASGDVIEFVQRTQNITFLEAAEKLAEEYGIEWKRRSFGNEARREVYYAANRTAAVFFYKAFRGGKNPALAYMAGRGIDDATLKKFGVGYADAEWDSLYKGLTQEGIDEKIMLELGLISASGGRTYDKYRNRVIFPIINTRGKVAGFGGRVLGDGVPKYLNSSESRVFKKKDNLYALNVTRQEILGKDQAILVEGYMDVISLYRHGVRNVTASLGTALTQGQAAMLKRCTSNVVIAYDADEAGVNAAARGMDILRDAGCDVKIVRIPGAKDPDEFIKANGREAFLDLVRGAEPLTEYKLSAARKDSDLSKTEDSLKFLKRAAAILRDLSPVEADVYIRKIAGDTHISEGAIRREIWGGTPDERPAPAKTAAKSAGGGEHAGGDMLERNFIRLTLMDDAYIARIKPYEHIFKTPGICRIYAAVAGLYDETGSIDIRKLEDALEQDDRELLRDIYDNVRLADKGGKVFEECVQSIRLAGLTARENQIIRMLKVANEEENQEKIIELTQELLRIQIETKGARSR